MSALPRNVVLDGEVVVVDEAGRTHFQRMQKRLMLRRPEEVARAAAGRLRATYFAFDLLGLEGYDLRLLPLRERKDLLRGLLPEAARCGTWTTWPRGAWPSTTRRASSTSRAWWPSARRRPMPLAAPPTGSRSPSCAPASSWWWASRGPAWGWTAACTSPRASGAASSTPAAWARAWAASWRRSGRR